MKRRGLLLDRDGVINVDHGYVSAPESFEFMAGIFPFLRTARDLGYRLAILTNQSGVARGLYTIADYENLTTWMLRCLAKEGVTIDLVLACFEHVEGAVPTLSRASFWRKPNPGMVLESAQRLRLDLARSAFLGDKITDMEAAKAGGVNARLMLVSKPSQKCENVTIVHNFDEALEGLRGLA